VIRLVPHTDVTLGPLKLSRGRPVFVEDVNAGEILAMTGDRFDVEQVIPRGRGESGALFIAPGGIGDTIMLEPVIRAWKAGHPDQVAVVAVSHGNDTLLRGLGVAMAGYPVPVTMLDQVAHVFCTERMIRENPEHHPTDLYEERWDICTPNKRPRLQIDPTEQAWSASHFPKTGRKRIGVQVRATALARTYPSTQEVVRRLLRKGHEVYLFGREGECNAADQPELGLLNLASRRHTLRQSLAMLDSCDAFLAPDSGLLHAAGALGVPTVALFGPFHWRERTRYYPTVRALQGLAPCAPCHHHKLAGIEWPENGPCNEAGHCVAMAQIEPRRIVAKLEEML
jgi:ADP-heptose:LPS heptosyltransferase